MSVYSEKYSIQDLKDMGDSNRRHELGEEKYNAFMDEIVNPKKKLASDADKDVVVQKYGSAKWAKGGEGKENKHVKRS